MTTVYPNDPTPQMTSNEAFSFLMAHPSVTFQPPPGRLGAGQFIYQGQSVVTNSNHLIEFAQHIILDDIDAEATADWYTDDESEIRTDPDEPPTGITLDAWIIALINDQLDVMEDEITYDESAVDRIADELRSIAKPTEYVAIAHTVIQLPFEVA